jgi:SAM-dependent methyltransferase
MALVRKPLQGVRNILRFNWPFYALAGSALLALFIVSYWLPAAFQKWIGLGIVLAILGIGVSVIASWWAYDASDLYELKWLPSEKEEIRILNIAAGFDEVSGLLQTKYPQAQLIVADFYDGERHTEPSIRRARKAYPPVAETISVQTRNLPFEATSFDIIVAMLAVHEIRDTGERTNFLRELHNVLKPKGRLYLTEHVRDIYNFSAYNIGAFHFHSRRAWLQNFKEAGFKIAGECKTTPFITTFVLEKYGNPD